MSNLHQELVHSLETEQLIALCTVIVGPGLGSKMLIWPDGQSKGDLQPADLNRQVRQHAEALFQQQKSERTSFDSDGQKSQVFIEVFPPPPRLIIIGAVHAAIPLITFAKVLGFRTIVVDPRSAFATPPALFPRRRADCEVAPGSTLTIGFQRRELFGGSQPRREIG